MTVTTGYLERPYLADSYLSGFSVSEYGVQVRLVIDKSVPVPMQVSQFVQDRETLHGLQVNQLVDASGAMPTQALLTVNTEAVTPVQVAMTVRDKEALCGTQLNQNIDSFSAYKAQVNLSVDERVSTGVQALLSFDAVLSELAAQVNMITAGAKVTPAQVAQIVDALAAKRTQVLMQMKDRTLSHGVQVNMGVVRTVTAGVQQKFSKLFQTLTDNYLVYPYLSTPYLGAEIHARQGVQVLMNAYVQTEQNAQVNMVVNKDVVPHVQVGMVVFKEVPVSAQVLMKIANRLAENSAQVSMQIVDKLQKQASQVLMRIENKLDPLGMQLLMIKAQVVNAQVTMVIYNTTQLRLLKVFASRGTPALGGNNWTCDPPAHTGDFSPNNLNTDVIEECYRSADGDTALVALKCDTGLPQGAFVDTLAMLGHNLTRSATVTLQGSNTADYGTIGFSTVLTTELNNMYYISPELPIRGYRYWRILIEDPTNTDGFIKVGTLIFGAAEIFSTLESFTDPITLGKKHFKDIVETEGFTNQSNDRALRKYLKLNFEKLLFNNGNYQKLAETIDMARTSLKVLYIPTPQYPSRFAIFGKLTTMPEETVISHGPAEEYIDLSLDIDESL